MPITEGIKLNLVKPTNTSNLTTRSTEFEVITIQNNITTTIQTTTILLFQYEELITNFIKFLQTEEYMVLYVPMFLGENYFQDQIQLNIFANFISNLCHLNTVVGRPPISENPNKIFLNFFQTQTYPSKILYSDFSLRSPYKKEQMTIAFPISGAEVKYVDMYQLDVTGPRIYNLIPSSGARYINPATNISFDIIDSEGSNIVPASINIDINDIPVIGSGTVVADPGFGAASLQKISDVRYAFNFNPTNDFNPALNPVRISGIAVDSAIPANSGVFSYEFYVWSVSDLVASIIGLPDTQPPLLQNLDPLPTQSDVLVNSNINLDIVDIHTGLNPESVIIKINNNTVIESGIITGTSYALTSISGLEGGKRYIINPVDILEFNSINTVSVYAEDNYSIAPNILDTEYYFLTQSNLHLEAKDLQVKNLEGTYVDLNLGHSYDITTTGIDLKVSYINYLLEGINLSGSYVKYNGDIVPFTYSSISGADYYDLYFNILPDYTRDGILEFYVVQDTLISGVTVFKRFYNTLLFGAEVCYDHEGRFEFADEISVLVKARDRGYISSENYLNYKFYIEPMYGSNLTAQIIGLNDRTSNMLGYYISNNPFHEYGKEMFLDLEVADYAGNKLYYSWKYKIADK